MSRPTGQMREGEGLLVVGDTAVDDDADDDDGGGGTPLFSSPSRNFRASYMFTAFLSTLFTITD